VLTGQLEVFAVQDEQCRMNRLTAPDYRNAAGCALLVGMLLLIIHAGSNEPFMDDFSYAKTAQQFAATGRFIFNGWAVETLGWQVLWGALFIKLFGFSFRVLQLSMIPLSMGCAYLSHQIFRKFGLTSGNSLLGTFTLTLSPLFLPVAASYMTDIPGLLAILVCIRMCQRAAEATSAREAILWLVAASVVNLIGGTARQIAWLGALIMVPSTAWMLRRWRGMKVAGVLLFLLSFFSVLGFMHWFAAQPYDVPQHVFNGPVSSRMALHGVVQVIKTTLCLLLIVLPVVVAWIVPLRQLSMRRRFSTVVIVVLLTSALAFLGWRRGADGVLAPWLTPLTAAQSLWVPIFPGASVEGSLFVLSVALSFVVLLGSVCFLSLVTNRNIRSAKPAESRLPSEAFWILGPFSLAYAAFLLPSGVYTMIQDRYVLGLVPTMVVLLLLLYQRTISIRISRSAALALILFGTYSIAGARTFFLASAALHQLLDRMESSGISRLDIETTPGAGLANDGWAQIENGGTINDRRIVNPPGKYRTVTRDAHLPGNCTNWFTSFTPDITAEYYVVQSPMPCFAPTDFAPEYYHAWLPPFRRAFYVEQRRPAQ
jgi:hypothetical protein